MSLAYSRYVAGIVSMFQNTWRPTRKLFVESTDIISVDLTAVWFVDGTMRVTMRISPHIRTISIW